MTSPSAFNPSTDISFVIRNNSSINRSIKVFNTKLNPGGVIDLMKIPGVTEDDIVTELTKGSLKALFAGGSLQVVSTTISFRTSDSAHSAFLAGIGIPNTRLVDAIALSQASFDIDPDNGNDANSGLPGFPIKTFAELNRRYGIGSTVSGALVFSEAAIAPTSNGLSLPQTTINIFSAGVAGSNGFPSSGTIIVITSGGPQTVFYTGTTLGSFTGCTGGTGTMATGNKVTSTTANHSQATINVLGNISSADPLFIRDIVIPQNGLFLVKGMAPTTIYTGTITTVQVQNRTMTGANQNSRWAISATGILDWTPYLDKRIRITSGTNTNMITGITKIVGAVINVASNGASLPQSTISSNTTEGFPASGNILVNTSAGVQTIAYTGVTATSGITAATFTGCSGGTGTMSTGGLIAPALAAALLSGVSRPPASGSSILLTNNPVNGVVSVSDAFVIESLTTITHGSVSAFAPSNNSSIFAFQDLNFAAVPNGSPSPSGNVVSKYAGCMFSGASIGTGFSAAASGRTIFCMSCMSDSLVNCSQTVSWNGGYARGGFACLAPASVLRIDFDTMSIQGPFAILDSGQIEMGAAAAFDCSTNGINVGTGATSCTSASAHLRAQFSGVNAFWGQGNTQVGVFCASGNIFRWTATLPTCTGALGDFKLGDKTLTTARAFDETSGAYTAVLTTSWANMALSVSSSGFGGNAHNLTRNSHIIQGDISA